MPLTPPPRTSNGMSIYPENLTEGDNAWLREVHK
jgi:hypothetical protein